MRNPKISSEQDLLNAAYGAASMRYKLLGMTVSPKKFEAHCKHHPDWDAVQNQIKPGDKIWPFEFNRKTLSMRRGFLVVRKRTPKWVLLTEVS